MPLNDRLIPTFSPKAPLLNHPWPLAPEIWPRNRVPIDKGHLARVPVWCMAPDKIHQRQRSLRLACMVCIRGSQQRQIQYSHTVINNMCKQWSVDRISRNPTAQHLSTYQVLLRSTGTTPLLLSPRLAGQWHRWRASVAHTPLHRLYIPR